MQPRGGSAELRRQQDRAPSGTARLLRQLGHAAFLLREQGRDGPPPRGSLPGGARVLAGPSRSCQAALPQPARPASSFAGAPRRLRQVLLAAPRSCTLAASLAGSGPAGTYAGEGRRGGTGPAPGRQKRRRQTRLARFPRRLEGGVEAAGAEDLGARVRGPALT